MQLCLPPESMFLTVYLRITHGLGARCWKRYNHKNHLCRPLRSQKQLLDVQETVSGSWSGGKHHSKSSPKDFSGGAVVKNLPANAEDTGSSPGPGRSHMPQSNQARAPQLLSLCSRAHAPQLLSPCATTTEARAPRARAPQQEKPPQ